MFFSLNYSSFLGRMFLPLNNYNNQIITVLPSRVFDTRIYELYESFLLTYFFNQTHYEKPTFLSFRFT